MSTGPADAPRTSAHSPHLDDGGSVILVRSACDHEASTLSDLALRSKSHWGYSPAFIDACRDELRWTADDIRHGCFIVAEAHGRIQGFYAIEHVSVTESELHSLFVAPDAIGKGYGRTLIEDAKTRARAGGARTMIIHGDPNAARFYTAAGAEQIGRRESDSIAGRFLPLFAIKL